MKGDFFWPFASGSQASPTSKDTFHKTGVRYFFKLSSANDLSRFLDALMILTIKAYDPG